MILQLDPTQHAHLGAIVSAGPAGVEIDGRAISCRVCGQLDALGLAAVKDGQERPRAIATPEGRAFHFRTAT